jgi:hypothetical protein
MLKPDGFDKKSYRRRGFAVAVLLVVTAAYLYEWIYRDGDLLRPAIAMIIGVSIIILSKWKRYLLILTFQTIAALGVMGSIRAFVTGKSVVIPLIGVAVGMGALILMRSRQEERWLARDSSSASSLQGLGLKPDKSSTVKSDQD